MNPAIPARRLVNVLPGVLSAGGSPLSLNAVFLTTNISVPIGTVLSFPSADSVADFFGGTSREAALAAIYFNGFTDSQSKPSELFFAQFNTSAVAAYLRGGSIASLTLAQLQLLSGTLTITINGAAHTTGSIDLSAATSPSNAAALIQTALNSALAGTTCVYNSTLSAMLIKSPTTGAASTIGFATANSFANGLKLTAVLGAVTSQGADVAVPATVLDDVTDVTQNFASFMTVFEPDTAGKLAFAAWVQTTEERYVYVAWDSDATVIAGAAPDSFGAQCEVLDYDGICPIYDSTGDIAAFVAGSIASIDFEQTNGRITFAFKGHAGLSATITTEFAANNAESNSYNYYANFATANANFVMFQRGSTPGAWLYLDAFVDQIWLTDRLQLALMNLLVAIRALPYNQQGYNQLRVAALDPIQAALNAGVIVPGVSLSNVQRAAINTSVGATTAADVVETQGWFLDIKDASPEVRAARGSPPMSFYYTDGGSIQRIELNSIEVQ